ncbi:MAG: fasciclin domain-containing protein, partial [Pseudomonadota bacterium]
IDRVLLPFDLDGNDRPNIVEIATGSDDFNILVMALSAAGLVETVQGLEDITVFAPTDAAFTQLALDLGLDPDTTGDDAVFEFIAGALAGLDPDGNPIPLLTDILLYHVSVGAKSAAALENLGTVETVFGTSFGVDGTELIDGEPDIENPNIVIPDILGGNGTIQAIDRVLIPIDIPGNETGETIEGTNGRDHLVGTSGDDEIFGLKGKDKLFGGDGDDALFGGAGRDLLAGGAGDDHLSGGWGRDYFDFRDLDGNDTVKDLSSRDKVIISTDDFSNRHELFAAIQQDGDDAVIQTEQGSITLEDVEVAHLNPHIFIFA